MGRIFFYDILQFLALFYFFGKKPNNTATPIKTIENFEKHR